VTKDTSIIIIL